MRHIRPCISHLRDLCHITLQHVVRVSGALLQPKYLCGTDFKACSSATTNCYSRPGPKSGVRSWLRHLILMTIIARPYGVRVPAQAAWAGGGSTFAPMCTQQELKHSGQQLLKASAHTSELADVRFCMGKPLTRASCSEQINKLQGMTPTGKDHVPLTMPSGLAFMLSA